jgi:hypothetical protein
LEAAHSGSAPFASEKRKLMDELDNPRESYKWTVAYHACMEMARRASEENEHSRVWSEEKS